MNGGNESKEETEIDLVGLATVVWLRRWLIAKVIGIFFALGVIIAFTSPEEYETSCTLIPEAMSEGSGLGGSLGGLAALAGVDLGGMAGGSSTINPGLYRSVAQSTPFLFDLMNNKFYFKDLGKDVSLYDYYMEYYKVGFVENVLFFPFTVMNWLSSEEHDTTYKPTRSEITSLTKYQEMCAEDLKGRILVTMDWELNLVTIDVMMQDPEVAAEVAIFTQKYITSYVENYAVSKSKEQLKFANGQLKERKNEFEYIQEKLALFRDQNQFVNTARARSEEERLQSNYNLAFSIYNQLAQQVESIELQINENTPVFTVLEPVRVPVDKSEPKRAVILIVSALLGGILGVGGVLIVKNVHGYDMPRMRKSNVIAN